VSESLNTAKNRLAPALALIRLAAQLAHSK
jgi:hypothetical protein